MKQDIEISDGSGDRKYFTIIPNYVLNHSTLYDRELYVQMKRMAGEGGTCWASRTTLGKQCGMSPRRVDKSLKYLIEHSWIKFVGTKEVITNGGVQSVKEYEISDLWKKNIDFYENRKGVAPGTPPFKQRGSTDDTKGVAPGAHKEELTTKNKHLTPPVENDGGVKASKDSLLIGEIIKAFEVVNPAYKKWYSRKPQRDACSRLIETHGIDKLQKVIALLPKTNKLQYVTTITTPIELEDRWATFEAQMTKKKQEHSDTATKYKVAFH